jgi:hypothetical protein
VPHFRNVRTFLHPCFDGIWYLSAEIIG